MVNILKPRISVIIRDDDDPDYPVFYHRVWTVDEDVQFATKTENFQWYELCGGSLEPIGGEAKRMALEHIWQKSHMKKEGICLKG